MAVSNEERFSRRCIENRSIFVDVKVIDYIDRAALNVRSLNLVGDASGNL